MVLVVLPLNTILNALRIGGERVDWRRMGLEALNRALHDLGVFALRHIGGRWERAGHLQVSQDNARTRRFGPRRAQITVEEYSLRRDGLRPLAPQDRLVYLEGYEGEVFPVEVVEDPSNTLLPHGPPFN
ncbi:hypothetical protein CAEBREN_20982 [Caenorhabditis brenneri]|uniref:Uncharacterized protein n=1 Tax=Caenorhabditis brenneri TaxID=135651 RepID=G0N1J6_CAEBE|nr:hypothetical protein CAEBREN_20982 [Caenorhabditis brenneri]